MARRENPGDSRPTATTFPNSTVAQEAKEQVRNLADDAKREASHMASQAGDMVQGLVSKQKDQAAQSLGSVAGALRDVGNRLNEQNDQDGAGFGQYAVRAADQVDRLSGYLRNRDLGTFVRDTESFARRHPDVFLGGTFLVVEPRRRLERERLRLESGLLGPDGPQRVRGRAVRRGEPAGLRVLSGRAFRPGRRARRSAGAPPERGPARAVRCADRRPFP
jgi:hypothetical protein